MLPELTENELESLDPELLGYLQDKQLWSKIDQKNEETNKSLWKYFVQALGILAFFGGVRRVAGDWKKPELAESWTTGNQYATQWFKERGGQFITQVTDADRQKIKTLLVQNWGKGQVKFAKAAVESGLMSKERAKLIYTSETHETNEAGGFMFAWNHNGKFKRWNGNPGACPHCGPNIGQVRPIDQPFDSGLMFAHKHPGCMCYTTYHTDSPVEADKTTTITHGRTWSGEKKL